MREVLKQFSTRGNNFLIAQHDQLCLSDPAGTPGSDWSLQLFTVRAGIGR